MRTFVKLFMLESFMFSLKWNHENPHIFLENFHETFQVFFFILKDLKIFGWTSGPQDGEYLSKEQ